MKKLERLLCLLPVLGLLMTAQAQVSTNTSNAVPPAAPTPSPTAPGLSAPPTNAPPQPVDPAKVAEIRKIMKLTGTVKMSQQFMDQLISGFKKQKENSSVSPEFWDHFEKKIGDQGVVDRMIPIYDHYYTLDDLKALDAFYQTPTGQKMLAADSQIMHANIVIGRHWTREVMNQLITEVNKEKAKTSTPAPTGAPAPAPVPVSAPALTPAPVPPPPTH